MKSLVVSSGGSKGAYAGGIIEYLSQEKDWDLFIGSSTGSLIVPLVAVNDIKALKEYYTSINSSKIYTRDPFIIKGNNNGNFKWSINHLNIALNLIKEGKKTLGTTTKVRSLISSVFTESHFNDVILNKKDIQICVTNLTLRKLEVKSIKDFTYSDFCDWIWASTCAPPFMSIVEKNGYEYVDSGVLRDIPIREAILAGSREIDVIVLNTKHRRGGVEKVRNVLHLIQMLSKTFLLKLQSENLDFLSLKEDIKIDSDILINVYYTQRELTNNSLLFDSDLMKKWWQEGYDVAESNNFESYILSKNSVRKIK